MASYQTPNDKYPWQESLSVLIERKKSEIELYRRLSRSLHSGNGLPDSIDDPALKPSSDQYVRDFGADPDR